MIGLACTGVGVHAAWRLYETERLWQAWWRLLQCLYTEIRYTSRPVKEVLSALDKREYRALAWLPSYEKNGLATGFCEEERAFAQSFFGFIGVSDLEGQLAHIQQYTERAKTKAKDAAERRERLGKAYVSTAVCAGIGIVILML